MKTVGAKQQNGSKRAGTVFLDDQAQRIQDFVQRNSGGDHLKKTLFTGEQRFPALAVGDVDHSPDEFTQVAASVEDRMAYDVNVPDPFVRMNDSVPKFEIRLVTDGFLEPFPDRGLIIWMNALEKGFESRWRSSRVES
jgi:hypothetical protein